MEIPELVSNWKTAKSDYIRQWSQLSASIKGSAIEPIVIDCALSIEDMVSTAITHLEGMLFITNNLCLKYMFSMSY